MKTGFDNQKYLTMQSEHIRDRIAQFGDKLYLEFGGKLFDDYHASRVLPGFAPDSKLPSTSSPFIGLNGTICVRFFEWWILIQLSLHPNYNLSQ